MAENTWRFWIDVGGTFTDVVAVRPNGQLITYKLLSSGKLKGRAGEGSGPGILIDSTRTSSIKNQYQGYTLAFMDTTGQEVARTTVQSFEAERGAFSLSEAGLDMGPGTRYELFSDEPAPVVAMRQLMGLRLDQDIGAIEVRLGTTRGTNALLERKGAPTALVTTRGLGDVLRIATQDRPDLFDLQVRKPEDLYTHVIEVDERLDAKGQVLQALSKDEVKRDLAVLKEKGVRSLAVCLMNSYRNNAHEIMIKEAAASLGFEQVSLSSEVSAVNKMVARGDTTVVDAYLTPIVREYIESIRERMPEASLRLMTSAGGLARAEDFWGRDSVLSGPAGGVVGFSKIAQQAGFQRAIGFDMGGTSTDVSRFEGRFEYQFETKKAGVRIVTPMLSIETVAAGGGSICAFDGQKLVVGPESAGADPGPACYGRGGPLAVTDLNVYLGKVPQDTFPFPLDHQEIENRLRGIGEAMEKEIGKKLEAHEIAEGFLRIANERMAASIKDISVAKGYDIRDYCLISFGGAGGQHACAIARTLGMKTILLHPYAGVLSAYGMGLADVKKFWETSVLKPCDASILTELISRFEAQEKVLRADLLAEGIPENGIKKARRLLELRYEGQSSTITVEDDDLNDLDDLDDLEEQESRKPSNLARAFTKAFVLKHIQLYGHEQKGRSLEIVTARLEVAGELSGAVPDHTPLQDHPESLSKPARSTPVIFEGRSYDAALYQREQLEPGSRLEGPAIILERTSTLVIDPGWVGEITDRGDLLLRDETGASARPESSSEVDPILLEVFNNQFASCAEQMGATLQRTALSTNVKERLDFSCAIFTSKGDLVANAPHVPVHLGAMSRCVKEVIAAIPQIDVGDVLITNDPFRGGSHLPDVTVITPVHDADGKLLFFTASRAHHAEIGGICPGSMPPDALSLLEEGVLIRPCKLVEKGELKEARLRALLTGAKYPSRSPDENLADIHAQVAANHTGSKDLLRMIERYGREVVIAYMDHIRHTAEMKMRAAIAKWPDGKHAFKDQMDDGTPVAVTVTVEGDGAVIDFEGTGPVMKGNLNANPAIVSSAVLYVLRCLIDEDIPLNSGVLAPVEIRVPEGILNPPAQDDPAKCPAVAGGNVETSQRVVDVLLGALKVCAASQGSMNNFIFGDDTFAYFETICGGAGAGPGYDGADAVHTHMTNTRLTDPEVLESRYPVHLRSFCIRKGSGGAGQFKGGDGISRVIEFLKPLDVSFLTSRRTTDPYGGAGGEPGSRGQNLLQRKVQDGSLSEPEVLDWKAQVKVKAGDVVTIHTPGGGGWGKA